MIPGPTILLVISYSLTQGRRVALAMALGVALGDFIAMTASLLGLGAVVLASAQLFTLLKWIGALYLVWMGVKLLRSEPSLGTLATPEPKAARAVFCPCEHRHRAEPEIHRLLHRLRAAVPAP